MSSTTTPRVWKIGSSIELGSTASINNTVRATTTTHSNDTVPGWRINTGVEGATYIAAKPQAISITSRLATLAKKPLPKESGARRSRIAEEEKDNGPQAPAWSTQELAGVMKARAAKPESVKGPRVLSAKHQERLARYPNISLAGTGLDMRKATTMPLTKMEYDHLTQALNRHEWFLNEEKFDFKNASHREKMLAFVGLKTDTWKTYQSHWGIMKARGYALTLSGARRYCSDHRHEIAGASAQSWIFAGQTHERISTMSGCHAVSKLIMWGSINSDDLPTGLPVGDIGHEELIELITQTNLPRSVCDGLVLQQAAGLRCARAGSLRHLQMRVVHSPGGHGLEQFRISLPRDKGARGRDNKFVHHYTDPYWNEYLQSLFMDATERYEATPLDRRDPLGEVLVLGYEGSAHNPLIKKAAKELGWPAELRWSTHAGKYGAAVEAGKAAAKDGCSAQEIADLIRKRTGHLSLGMARKYSEDRADKVQRGKAHLWLAQWIKNPEDQTLPYEDFLEQELNHILRNKRRIVSGVER